MRIKRMGVTVFAVALVLCTALAALPTVARAEEALSLPDQAFQNALIAAGVDENRDGVLTVSELAKYAGSLDLHGKDITNVTGLGYAINLKSLNLNDNSIASLPAEIRNCRELTALDVGGNPITALPQDITALTKLKTLKLSGTSLGALPADMGRMTALETLDLSSTSFQALPEQLKNLPALANLSAKNLGLKTLPVWLGQCAALQQLRLDGNQLSALPDLSALDNLTVLTLNSNNFASLPVQVTILSNLKRLEMSYNDLGSLPGGINLLTKLEELRLNGCTLGQLPSEIGGLTALRVLELSSNSLMSLPASLGNLTVLRELDLSINRLSGLPRDVFANMSLQELNLNSNYLNPRGGDDLDEINKAPSGAHKLYLEQYTFTGIYDDNGTQRTKECYQGETVSLPLPQIPEGQTFVGWDLNGDGSADTDAAGTGVFVAPSYQDVTVPFTPVFASDGQVVVTFRAGDHGRVDGSPGTVRKLLAGQTLASVPAVQVDEGYRFTGWKRTGGDGSLLSSDDICNQTFLEPAEFTAQYADNSANLKTLSASTGALSPSFYAYSYSYLLILPDDASDTGSVTLDATAQAEGAVLSVQEGGTLPLSVDVAKGQRKTVHIVVTAPDQSFTKTYTVKIVHADESGAALNDLTLTSNSQSAGTVEPFDPDTQTYHVNLSPEDDTLHIQTGVATGAAVAFQTREGGGFVPAVSGGIDFDVSAGVDFQVTVRVTSPDGYSQRLYYLLIRREWSTDCTLSELTGTPELIMVSESSAKNVYTMALPEKTASGAIQFQTSYRFAKAVVTNATLADGTATVALENGESRTVSIQVVAQDTSKTKTYEITVTRAMAIPAVKATSASYNSVNLTWGAVAGASGYEVDRATSSTGDYSKVATITSGSTVTCTDTGLTTGQSYYYKVRAYRTGGNSTTIYSGDSTVVSAIPVPVAPASVKAASASYSSVNLTWGAVTGASGYEIYLATSSTGAYDMVAAIPSGTTVAYTNTGLTTGTTYYYKLRAYRMVDSTKVYGGYSAVVSTKPVPAAPAGVKAASASYNGVGLTWGAVTGAGGYEIYRATSSTGAYGKIAAITGGATVAYTNTGLATGTTYYYKLVAYRMVGSTKVYGGYSSAVSAKPAPAAPAGVKAASASYNGVGLTWGAVTGAGGYEIFRATSSTGAYGKVATITGGATVAYTNTGLTTGTTYYYKLRAYRLVGSAKVYGGYSTVVSAKPVPAAPTGVKAASASYNSVKLTWGAVTGATKYAVFRATSSTGTYTWLAETTSTSYTNAGLTTGATYYYKVRTYRLVGSTKVYSVYSAMVSAKPVPAMPTAPKATAASYNSLKVTWSAVTGAGGYQVWRSTAAGSGYKLAVTVAATSYTNTGLITGTTYYYKIRAYRTVNGVKVYGPYAAVVSAKPVPATPAAPKAASASYNSVKVTWSAVTGAGGYQVWRSTAAGSGYKLAVTVAATSYTNTGLATGTTYYYKIRAYRTVNGVKVYGPYAAVVSAKPVPAAPAGVKAVRASSTSVKVSWNAVMGASGYEVFRASSSAGTYTLVKTTTSLSWSNTRLVTGKTYYYKVRAYRLVAGVKVYGGYGVISYAKP